MSKRKFKTEVDQLLQLIIHSLYSHKEIAIRELISNASDALDKLKYLTLTDDAYKAIPFDPRIDISFDGEDKKFLKISDSGIGMNEEDLNNQIGTIASSGTKNFISRLNENPADDINLIGQFGVGFYSAFMIADKVEVITRGAGEDKAWKWESDGKSGYTVTETERESHGTTVIVHLNDEGKEYASRWQIEEIIKKYSNHIPFPIYLEYTEAPYDEKGNKKEKKRQKRNRSTAPLPCGPALNRN
ncbi:MAG: ATP-binding protein [Desulfobacteraceae bacterium]|jgi:molecular chaperone HtpG